MGRVLGTGTEGELTKGASFPDQFQIFQKAVSTFP
jgi:hypothetical protein